MKCSFLGGSRSRYGRPVMLLATDWHPWFSYEWWNDIGVPGLGALGSIAVGAGAIAVALHSNRIAKQAGDRETKAQADADAAAKRAERGDFGSLCTRWVASAISEIAASSTEPVAQIGMTGTVYAQEPVRSTEPLKQEVDVRAASLGHHSADLVKSISDRIKVLSAVGTKHGRGLIDLGRQTSLQSIATWVADPEEWWIRELEARRVRADFDKFEAKLAADFPTNLP